MEYTEQDLIELYEDVLYFLLKSAIMCSSWMSTDYPNTLPALSYLRAFALSVLKRQGRVFLRVKSMVSKGYKQTFEHVTKRIRKKHGMNKTKEHRAYLDARGRCCCTTNRSYSRYGGRGVRFLFNSFVEFYAEVGPAPTKCHSLDRIDVNGNYEAGNIRWATATQQQRNKRNNRLVTKDGVTKTAVEWEQILGLKKGIVASRFHQGRPDAALENGKVERKDSKLFEFRGSMLPLYKLSQYASVKDATFRARIRRGWRVEDAMFLDKKVNGLWTRQDGQKKS